MLKQVNTQRYMQVLKEAHKYISVKEVLEIGNLNDYEDTGTQYLLKCPYHDDEVPSFRIDKAKGIWHCFSCGRGGTILKLLHHLSNSTSSVSGFVDSFLKSQNLMSSNLGYISIFSDKSDIPKEFKQRRIFNRHMASMTTPVSTLVNNVKSINDSYDNLATMITLMQSDISNKDVYSIIHAQNDIGIELDSDELMDIAELIKDEV